MTEQEAIDVIKHLVFCGLCTTGPCDQCERKLAKDAALSALEEVQQYRSIGTVEECVDAMEKKKAKKPIRMFPCKSVGFFKCQNCKELLSINKPFCEECGQAIDWNENEVPESR